MTHSLEPFEMVKDYWAAEDSIDEFYNCKNFLKFQTDKRQEKPVTLYVHGVVLKKINYDFYKILNESQK